MSSGASATRGAPEARTGAKADLVLYNGRVHTVDARSSIVEALAIRDGRVLAVGAASEVRNTAGPGTRQVDLGRRAVVPGLIDSHNHMCGGAGLTFIQPSLEGSRSIADVVRRAQEAVKKTPPGKWVVTAMVGEPTISHLLEERRYPTRWDLDPVSPDHPVAIAAPHVGILNSCAMRRLGIKQDSKPPEGGEFGRDPVIGELDGRFYEMAWRAMILKQLPPSTHQDWVDGIRAACKAYNAAGLTGVLEHGVTWEHYKAYQEVHDQGGLTVRCTLHLRVLPTVTPDVLEHVCRQVALEAKKGDELLRLTGLKVQIDGGVGIGTAWMRKPYKTAHGAESTGIPVITGEQFEGILRACVRHNIELSQHDSGGAAIDFVLDVYKKVHAETPLTGRRFTMVHCQFPSDENIEDIRRLGCVVVTQTVFLYSMGIGYIKHLGRELADQAMPIRRWLDAGVPLALGSDATVNPYPPLLGIWHAEDRRDKTTNEILGAESRISRAEALRCYTRYSALAAGEAHLKGSLEPGLLADLVVLPEDPTVCPLEKVKDMPVLATLVGGKLVHGEL